MMAYIQPAEPCPYIWDGESRFGPFDVVYVDRDGWEAHCEMSRYDGLECFVNEYIIDFDRDRALAASRAITGIKKRWKVTDALVGLEINRKLQEHNEQSKLNAEFVREYIWQILTFKPIDHFAPAMGGGWLVTVSDYEKLPEVVRTLIDEVEYRVVRGEHFLAIKFVSKTKALELACRYTLTQKVAIRAESAIPWDQVAAAPKPVDTVEAQLAQVEQAAKVSQNGVSSNGSH